MRDFISIFHTRPIFTTLGEMTDADKAMNPEHFGSDPGNMFGFESRITFG